MLHIVEHAVPGAPLVVLVHGTMDRSTSFAKVQRRLDDLTTIAYDRRGYARSIRGGVGTRVSDHVEDLIALLDGRPATVAGHSYGGVVALAAAQRHPDVVRSVLAFEAPTPWLPWWPTDTAGGTAVRAAPADAAEAFMRRLLGDRIWDRMPEATRDERRSEGPALVADITSIREPEPPFDPAQVQVPVVIGNGSASEPHHQEGARRLAAALPDAVHSVVEGATHGAHRSHAEAFAALVRDAVARGAA